MTKEKTTKPRKQRVKPGPKPGRPAGKHKEAADARRLSKYNAKGKWLDGRWFDSQMEAARYLQLKELRKANLISEIEFQPEFSVSINNKQMFVYKADFSYNLIDPVTSRPLEHIIEDVKGMKTPVYRLKKKMVEAAYDIFVAELPAKKRPKNYKGERPITQITGWVGAVPSKARPNQRYWLPEVLIEGEKD